MRARTVVTAILVAVLALTSCGHGSGDLDQYDPVAASVWPDLTGVQVVSSRGYAGLDCCESHPYLREVLLNVQSTSDFDEASDVVVKGLRNAGWTDYDCVGVVCMQHDAYRVALYHPRGHEKRGNTDVLIRLTRDANLGARALVARLGPNRAPIAAGGLRSAADTSSPTETATPLRPS